MVSSGPLVAAAKWLVLGAAVLLLGGMGVLLWVGLTNQISPEATVAYALGPRASDLLAQSIRIGTDTHATVCSFSAWLLGR